MRARIFPEVTSNQYRLLLQYLEREGYTPRAVGHA